VKHDDDAADTVADGAVETIAVPDTEPRTVAVPDDPKTVLVPDAAEATVFVPDDAPKKRPERERSSLPWLPIALGVLFVLACATCVLGVVLFGGSDRVPATCTREARPGALAVTCSAPAQPSASRARVVLMLDGRRVHEETVDLAPAQPIEQRYELPGLRSQSECECEVELVR
jgi:hypothetical protein